MIVLDHPGWHAGADGGHYRAVRGKDATWLAAVAEGRRAPRLTRVAGIGATRPKLDSFDPARLDAHRLLVAPLRQAGQVRRLRNPDLWDAIANSIIRQVIRAGHARAMYRTFCQRHGQPVETPAGPVHLSPDAATVASLPEREFRSLGMAFKAAPLRNAAHAYLEHAHAWAAMDPNELVEDIQRVPRIGPWTAGASVADYTNDYRLYPFADLAVRTWAHELAPTLSLPREESAFARRWDTLAKDQLGELTLLTLAWGARHAHTR